MTPKDYEELVELLDGRIDELTKPIPSKQILRFAEAIRAAELGDDETPATYSSEDYGNLDQARRIVLDLLPSILTDIRAKSIDPDSGWRFEAVTAGNGDNDLCAICNSPFQHFGNTVKVHGIDMHENAYHGVCRPCVRNYASEDFFETDGLEAWLKVNRSVSPSTIEDDHKTEQQRVDLIDAIRNHAHETHYAADIAQQASDWAAGAFGEWR